MTSCFKRLLLWSVFFISVDSALAFESLSLNSLNFKLDPETREGRVNAQELSMVSGPLKVNSESPDLFFSLKEGVFESTLEGVNFIFDFGKESFLGGLSHIETENLDVEYYKDQRLRVENEGLTVGHTGGTQFVPRLTLTCAARAQKSVVEDVSSQCLHLGRLQIPILNFDQLSGKAVAKSLGAFNKSLNKSIDELEEIDLMILNNAFNLTFKARFIFDLKIKASGAINYHSEQGLIDIRLDKAKVGIFSLKGRILKELAERGFESISVSGDHILIQL